MKDGSICSKKVVSSSPATKERIDMKEGSECFNKVVPSSPAMDEQKKSDEEGSYPAHAEVTCMRRIRIKVKGAARCGQACCKGTT